MMSLLKQTRDNNEIASGLIETEVGCGGEKRETDNPV